MNPIRWLFKEWRTLLRSRKLIIALVGVSFIPALYSGTYLWAFWDPYAHVERLPVAVVNEDRPIEYQGKTVRVGGDLEDELKKDQAFEWHFISRDEAEAGFRSNRYYIEIAIPEDFSRRATTLTEQQPTPLELTIRLNEGLNYTVGKIGQTGVEKIRRQLAENLTKNYSEALFRSLGDLHDGLVKAGSGSAELHSGIQEAAAGVDRLLAALKEGQPSLKQLDQGAAALSKANAQLSAGAGQLNDGAAKLSGGLDQLSAALGALQTGSVSLSEGLAQASAGAKQLSGGLDQLAKAHPEWSAEPAWAAVVQTGAQVAAGIDRLTASSGQLAAGMTQAAGSRTALTDGAKELSRHAGELAQGGTQASAGAAQAASGVHQVAAGWDQLLANVGLLADGEKKLADGSGELNRALTEGADKLGGIHASQDLYEMMANPVHLKEEYVNPLPNYGTGMAPFFVSVSLFVGALLLSTVFPVRETATLPPSGLMWFVSKYGLLALVSLAQTVIACLVLTAAVGLEPISLLKFGGFVLFCSLTFMALIQFLVTAGDNAGRFIGVVLLVLQLTATSGTYPVELIPEGLQRIHGFLPITYTVEGFRSLITTGDDEALRRDLGVLALFLAASLLLTLLVLTRLHRKKGSAAA